MKISYNRIRAAAVLYAVIPIIIFFFGWLSLLWAVIFSALLLAAGFFFLKNAGKRDGKKTNVVISVKMLIIIGVIAFLWCIFAGQGGYIHQSNDHAIRNAIFRDLIKKPWPVVYEGDMLLSYYIAHWMPPALLAKLVYAATGSVAAGYAAGNVFLLIWSSIGVYLALLLVVILTGSKKNPHIFAAVLLFIFFSGLDIIGTLITGNNNGIHYERWATFAQFSSPTTCLFWVYNQTIVIWLVTFCIINERSVKNFAFLGLLALPFGPLPFIGIVMMCIIKAAVISLRMIKKGKTAEAFKNIFSLQNILSCAAILPVYYLYYFSNAIISNDAVYGGKQFDVSFRINDLLVKTAEEGNIKKIVLMVLFYLIFFVLEAGVYIAVILVYNKIKRVKNDPVFIGTMAVLLFIPLFKLGSGNDFSMRVSIPPILYIAVEFIKRYIETIPPNWKFKSLDEFVRKHTWYFAASMIFLLGISTPYMEFQREIYYTVTDAESGIEYYETESLDDVGEKNNFTAKNYKDSNFYKYICKK